MPLSPAARAAQYRGYAGDLRRMAGQSGAEADRQQLATLADEFDQLAESLEHSDLRS
jgi:hypothetical protein